MDITEKKIQSLCTEKVFDRAINYYREGRIKNIERFGSTIKASVLGSRSDPYSVEIELEDLNASCTCPYDLRGYCKHIIAVLLKLKDSSIEDREKDIEKILKETDKEKLRDFLISEIKNNKGVRERFLAYFKENDSKTSFSEYKEKIEEKFPDPESKSMHYGKPDLSEHKQLANSYLKKGKPKEALKIYKAITEVKIENLNLIEGYYGEDIWEEIKKIIDIIEEYQISDKEKRKHIKYFFEIWTTDEKYYGQFKDLYEKALLKISKTEKDAEYLKNIIEEKILSPDEIENRKEISYYETERLISNYEKLLEKLDRLDKKLDLYENYYLQIPDICIKYAKCLQSKGQKQKAIQILKEGKEKFPEDESKKLKKTLIDLLDENTEKYREEYREYTGDLFEETGNWKYYEKLKEVYKDEKWEKKIKEYEKKFKDSNPERLIQLYLHENKTKKAFCKLIEAVKSEKRVGRGKTDKESGLNLLKKYQEKISDYNQRKYYETYKELLEPFLENHTGRSHYKKIVGYLKEMKKLGFEKDLKEFIDHLKEKHSNRPAFLDEIEKLSINKK